MVRAKFRCNEITKSVYYGQSHDTDKVVLVAVTDGGNQSWSKWTPGGRLEMTINNPEALNQFKIGQCYYLDFTEAPATEVLEAK